MTTADAVTEMVGAAFRHFGGVGEAGAKIIHHREHREIMTKIHELKTHPTYFAEIMNGNKRFELRKNDRDFKVGDDLLLCEYDPYHGRFTGNKILVTVTYITLENLWLAPGMCAMSIKPKDGSE